MTSFAFSVRPCVLALSCALAWPGFVWAQKSLPQVVVSASRSEQPVTDVVADVSLVDRASIERLGAASVADVLQRMPGVSVMRNGGPASTTSVQLRGAEGRFTAVFVDGVRIDSQSTGGASWHALPLSQVDRIEVLRGPAAAVYGSDALAGVVQIFTRTGEQGLFPSLHLGLGSHGLREIDAALRGGNESIDYALGLGLESSSGFNANPAGNPDSDGYGNRSFSGRLGWRISPAQKLELTLLQNRQKAGYDGWTPGQDDQAHSQVRSAGLNWNSRWSESWSTRLSLGQGSERYESSPSPYLSNTQVTSALLRNEWRLGSGLLTADIERREDRLHNENTFPLRTKRHQDALALGWGQRWGAHTLALNARRDDDSEFGVHTTGSAAYAYALSKSWQLTASAGTAFRAPTLFQRFSLYGSADLKAETARNLEAGLRWQEGASRASAVVYRNRIRDLIDYQVGPGPCANGLGEFAGCYGNAGRASHSGLTLAGETKWAEVLLGASLDTMSHRNQDSGLWLARRARTQAQVSASTAVGAWQLGGEVIHQGRRFDDAANLHPLAAHTLLNLSASTQIARDWRLLVRLDNASDKAYESVLGYATAGRTFYLGLNWAPH